MKVSLGSCGRFHSIVLAKGLFEMGCLDTCFSAGLLKRDWKTLPDGFLSKVKFNWSINFSDRVYTKLCIERFVSNSGWYTARDWFFDQWMARLVRQSTQQADLFVLWANCAEKTILTLKNRGVPVVVESGSCHIDVQTEILKNEYAERDVRWAPVWAENRRRMVSEYDLASRVAVPSSIVRDSFLKMGVPAEKLLVIPYGRPETKIFANNKPELAGRKLRLLFVGQVSFQKGAFYLLRAWMDHFRDRPDMDLTLVGGVSFECQGLVRQALDVCLNLSVVGPVIHDRVFKFYQEADVFIFPSLQEGQAMVIGEAIASGLAIVCTQASGWGDFLIDGQSCLELQAGSIESIVTAVERLIEDLDACRRIAARAQLETGMMSWKTYPLRALAAYNSILLS